MHNIIAAFGVLQGSFQLIGLLIVGVALLRAEPINRDELERADYRSQSWPKA